MPRGCHTHELLFYCQDKAGDTDFENHQGIRWSLIEHLESKIGREFLHPRCLFPEIKDLKTKWERRHRALPWRASRAKVGCCGGEQCVVQGMPGVQQNESGRVITEWSTEAFLPGVSPSALDLYPE